MHRCGWALAIASIVMMVAGCATLHPDYETPVVNVSSIRALPAEGVAPRFEIGLHIVNPNRSPLALYGIAYSLKLDGEETLGVEIVKRACEAPMRQIAENAGYEGGVVVDKVRNLTGNTGLNAATGEYEDLVKAGIIDAAKVTRSALQNAGSIAALFLTTEAVVADKPEEGGAAPGMPDMDF